MLFAQKQKSYIVGIGNYESLYIGINKTFKSNVYLETALGFNPFYIKNKNYEVFYLSGGHFLFNNKKRPCKIGIHVKAMVWHLNNIYNRFVVFSPNPEMRISKKIKKINFSFTGGYLYNTPFYYKRKTYQEVGWPNEWQPSFSFQAQINF